MHDKSMLGKFCYFACDTIIKSNTNGDEQIGLINCIIRVHTAMHS